MEIHSIKMDSMLDCLRVMSKVMRSVSGLG